LKYTPETLQQMNVQQLAEAFNDVLYVRTKRSRLEPED
jgi:hypothetical protein